MDTIAIITPLLASIPAIGAAFFAYRSSSKATKVEQTKVDGIVFERSQQFYEKVMASADKEVTRLQTQVDRLHDQLGRVNDQLAKEQDVSNALRNHLRTMQGQVTVMETTLDALRSQIGGSAKPAKSQQPERPEDG